MKLLKTLIVKLLSQETRDLPKPADVTANNTYLTADRMFREILPHHVMSE